MKWKCCDTKVTQWSMGLWDCLSPNLTSPVLGMWHGWVKLCSVGCSHRYWKGNNIPNSIGLFWGFNEIMHIKLLGIVSAIQYEFSKCCLFHHLPRTQSYYIVELKFKFNALLLKSLYSYQCTTPKYATLAKGLIWVESSWETADDAQTKQPFSSPPFWLKVGHKFPFLRALLLFSPVSESRDSSYHLR